MADISCPSCGSREVRDLGPIPDAVEFAGKERDEIFPGGRLWECRACTLWFRMPRLADADLDRLYRSGADDAWSENEQYRVDWIAARTELIRAGTSGAVLDVGCWDGRFLGTLADLPVEPLGIEMNPNAAGRAANRGVRIVANDLRKLAETGLSCSAITAFDVIEHVPDPLAFLRACRRNLAVGGHLVIATGDTQSLPFRLLGPRHQYCIWPEHIAFVSASWFARAAGEAQFDVVRSIGYRREQPGPAGIFFDMAKSLAYAISPGLFASLRRHGVGRPAHQVKQAYPPLWPSARDHALTILRAVA